MQTPFGHAAEPWTSWDILAGSRRTPATPPPPRRRRRKAIACYLAYRRDGGENHYRRRPPRLRRDPIPAAGNAPRPSPFSSNSPPIPNAACRLLPFIRALQAIVAGNRDRTLADAPDLDLHDGCRDPLPDRNPGNPGSSSDGRSDPTSSARAVEGPRFHATAAEARAQSRPPARVRWAKPASDGALVAGRFKNALTGTAH